MAPNVQLRSSASESNECLRNEDNDPFLLDWSPCSLEEHLKKANCKRNPSCVFGLGENSPEGVLQVEKMAKKLHETAIQGRKNEEIPFAGLRNLGATCYANVVLQFLFFLRPFREAILNIDTDLSQYKNSGDYEHCTHSSQNQTNQLEKSIMELQLLFATLLKGHGSCVSPKKFLEALDLTTFVEQDIQEFVNLLLSLVEKYLHNSPTKTYETLISDVFQGSRRFVTTCHSCGQVSEASKTDSSFTELQVSAYHPGSIEDALSNMVMEELLTGDNQYLCEFCNGKRDASRKMVFDKLPPVLMLQLLRTTFDLTSGEKRKTHAKVSFPLEMDVHELLNMDTNEVKTYRLKAICFHRGSSAYCGHYTVQLFDDSSNKWFEFDDAQVKCCVSNSSAWKSDSPSGNGLDSVSNERRKRAKLRLFDKSANGTTNRRPTLSSTSACLLVYVLSDNMYRFGDLEESRLPDLLQDIINLENSELDIAFEVEKASVDSKVSEMERQKSEYLSLLPKLSARTCIETSDLVSYGYIPTSWLREWVKVRDGSMMPIDCSPYICEHGGLNPQSIIHVKRVAQEAFDWLIEKYGANSLLLRGPQCHCMQRNDEFTSYLMNPKDNINVISEKKDLSPNCPVSYIEKNFFKRWKKLSLSCKHGVDFVRKLTKLVKEFSLSRYCVHEKLIVEDWKEISCSLGKHLYDLLQFLSRDTEVRFDYFIVFQNDSHATFCDECHEKSTEMKEEISSIRQLKRLEKASLGELMKPKYSLQVVRFLVQQMKYRQTEGRTSASNEESRYLISSSWFEKWSDYLLNNGKRPEISPLEGLICEHNLLLYDLSTADDLFDRRVLCVSASCWEEIVKAYIDGYFDVNGVKLELKEEMDGCCKGVFSIPNCYDCMKKRKDPENKDEIELVLIKVNEMEQVQDKRRSRVLRVQCNRSNSISELKLIIFQYLDIAPVAQELYLGKGMSLVHASSSLKDYNISDGSLLFLYIDKSKIDNGSEDFCALPEDSKVELGFMGSQLFGL
ncbi:Ubiquitin carboxyl-terminal hydrolase 26 [Galdieria sulphuraria]|nr:Ubiquitin carboxyl-terminal hydrolase 26 [Galdieria sulphuraria]